MENTHNNIHYCHVCGKEMNEVNNHERTVNYKGKTVHVTSIKAFICPNCGEVVYSSDEVKRIEEIVRNTVSEH